MSEIDDLILEVEKHPCLWDNEDEYYQNKLKRESAWDEICRNLFLNWDDSRQEDKKNMYDIKKKQWNNVRDGYRKYLQRVKSTGYTKKYTYGDNLHFLRPVLIARNREGSLAPESPEFLTVEYLENEGESAAEEDNEENEEEYIRNKSFRRGKLRIQSKSNKTDNHSKNHSYQKILSKIQRRTNPDLNQDYQDEDSQFLLSLRSDLRVMTKSQKLQFKLGMIQLIQSITESGQST